MDELKLKLSSWVFRNFVSNIAANAISNKVGINPEISLNDLTVSLEDGVVKAHMDIDILVTKNELTKLMKNAKISGAIMDKI